MYPPVLRNRTKYIQKEMTRIREKCAYYTRMYARIYRPPCMYFEAFDWYVEYYGDIPTVSYPYQLLFIRLFGQASTFCSN